MIVDLSSFRSVTSFVAALKERFEAIDILVNNAGTLMNSKKLTTDGFETTIQVNFLGHVFLTWSLLSLLKHSHDPKVYCILQIAIQLFESLSFPS